MCRWGRALPGTLRNTALLCSSTKFLQILTICGCLVYVPVRRPWWSQETVAVVTGANKGLGYEMVRRFAEDGLTVVLTARNSGRGTAALDALKAAGLKSVWFHPLDTLSSESIEALAVWLKTKFGGIDILVSVSG